MEGHNHCKAYDSSDGCYKYAPEVDYHRIILGKQEIEALQRKEPYQAVEHQHHESLHQPEEDKNHHDDYQQG